MGKFRVICISSPLSHSRHCSLFSIFSSPSDNGGSVFSLRYFLKLSRASPSASHLRVPFRSKMVSEFSASQFNKVYLKGIVLAFRIRLS
jgi:hypothetical protein